MPRNSRSRTRYPKRGGEREHRVVAAEKLGRPLRPGEVVHHINGNGHDNSPENLEVFDSHAEHMRWHMANSDLIERMIVGAQAKGYSRVPRVWGEKHWKARLTEESVKEIRRRRAAGETTVALGREFGVRHTQISNICNGKSWKHIL